VIKTLTRQTNTSHAARLCSWIAIALLLLMPALATAQTFVQAYDCTTETPACTTQSIKTPTATAGIHFQGAQTAGNFNAVVVGWSDTTSYVTSVTDTSGNAYVLAAGTVAANGISQEVFYAANIAAAAAGANEVVVQFNKAAADPDVRIAEYSGLATTRPVDGSNGATGSSASANSGGITITNATDLIFGAGTTGNAFTAAGAGFTARVPIATPFFDLTEDKAVAATGSYNATGTLNTGAWAMQVVGFSTIAIADPGAPSVTSLDVTTGNTTGGTAVNITGTNFVGGATVLFGAASGVNCTVTSATNIACTTPAHAAGQVGVTVANPNDGSPSTLPNAFTFAAIDPSPTNIAPATGSSNGGDSVTITGFNFSGPNQVKFGAVNGTGGQSATNVSTPNSQTITATTPAHASGAVNYEVINGDNGNNTTVNNPFTYQVGTGPINFIQEADAGDAINSRTSIDVIVPGTQAAGDLNVVIIGFADVAQHTIQVTDLAGNTYTQALPPQATNGTVTALTQVIFYAKNIAANPANTVTVHFNPAALAPDVRVAEYSGLDTANPLDTAAAAAASAFDGNGQTATADSGPISTTFANNLIIAGATVENQVTAPGLINIAITANGNLIEHKVNSVAQAGVHATAGLSGDQDWVMQAVVFHTSTVAPTPDFTVAGSAFSPANGAAGTSATSTITVTAVNAFASAVNLTCTITPVETTSPPTCSFDHPSVTPGSAPATAILTIKTTAASSASLSAPQNNSMSPMYAVWLPIPAITLAGLGFSARRRKLGIGLMCILMITLILLLAGCGGGSSSSGGGGGGGGGGTAATPSGPYTVTVTATSGSLTHTVSPALTFTVN